MEGGIVERWEEAMLTGGSDVDEDDYGGEKERNVDGYERSEGLNDEVRSNDGSGVRWEDEAEEETEEEREEG